jgi:hypothetical protein
MHSYLPNLNSKKAEVLTKALLKMSEFYQLSGKTLSEIIGISEASASRLHQGKKIIVPETKEGELVLLLLRIYRSLNSLVGNQHAKAIAWLTHPNQAFQEQVPLEYIKTVSGLVDVANYLDAMRGKL